MIRKTINPFYIINHITMPREEREDGLYKTFVFDSFTDALSWMIQCSFVIEQLNHHPEWTNIYNKVMVRSCTHDRGNIITEKDIELSRSLDEEYLKFKNNS